MSFTTTNFRIQYEWNDTSGPGLTWTTITDYMTAFKIVRPHKSAGSITCSLINDTLDSSTHPGNDQHIRKGQRVRAQVLVASTWKNVFQGTIKTVDTTFNSTAVSVAGTRLITFMAHDHLHKRHQKPHSHGVGKVDDARAYIDPPFSADGQTTSKSSVGVNTFENDNTTEWEQILLTRDTQQGYAWVDKDDVLQLQSPAFKSTANKATITEANYSKVDLNYTIENIINSVVVKEIKKYKNGKTHVVHKGVWERSGSITKYGRFRAVYTVQDHLNTWADDAAFANNILDNNADPATVPVGCGIPIVTTGDVANFLDAIDLADKVTIRVDGTVYAVRVDTITIEGDGVILGLGLTFTHQTITYKPARRVTHSASLAGAGSDTGYGNVSDGQIETAHVDDLAITTPKIADGAINSAKVGFVLGDIGGSKITAVGGTGPVSPATGDYWIDTANGNILKRWNGSAWVSVQDTAIATAQSAATTAQTIANGKNTVFIQGTTPTATRTNDQWIDTANGNVLKTWNGTSWVNSQDAAIATAQTAANTAQTTANGKNKVTYSTSTPGATANTAGDLWFRTSGATVIEQWQGNGGTSWTQVTITNAVIANLDAGKITTGFISASRLQVGSTFNELLNPGFEDGVVSPHQVVGTGVTAATNITGVRSGLTALRFVLPALAADTVCLNANGDPTITSLHMKVKQGDVIRAEAWSKNGTVTGAPTAKIRIDIRNGLNANIQTVTSSAVTLTSSYQQLLAELTVSGASAAYAVMEIIFNGSALNDVTWIDDMSLAQKVGATVIQDGAITTTQIAANTIVAGNIAAGTITATELAAGAVTAQKLLVTVGGGNLLDNSSFETALATFGVNPDVGWSAAFGVRAAFSYVTTDKWTGTRSVQVNPATNTDGTAFVFPAIAVNTGDKITTSIYFKIVSGTEVAANVQIRQTGPSYIVTGPASGTAVYSVMAAGNGWYRAITSATFTSSGNYRPAVFNSNGTTANDTTFLFDAAQMERGDVATSYAPRVDEILPGTIIANMLSANSVVAGTIAANAVVAGNIAAGAIDAMTITGPTIRTKATGNRLIIRDDGSEGIIEFYTGTAGEVGGFVNPGGGGGAARHKIVFGTSRDTSGSFAVQGQMTLWSISASLMPMLELNGADLKATFQTSPVNMGGNITADKDITGDRVFINNPASTTNAANIRMAANGAQIALNTSLSKFKVDQKAITLAEVKGLLDVVPKTWYDLTDYEENGKSKKGLNRVPGFVAEEIEKHAPVFSEYRDGKLSAVSYDRVPAGLLLLIQDQEKRIKNLEAQLTKG